MPACPAVAGKRVDSYCETYAEYRGAGMTVPREEPLARRLGLSGSRRKRARLGELLPWTDAV